MRLPSARLWQDRTGNAHRTGSVYSRLAGGLSNAACLYDKIFHLSQLSRVSWLTDSCAVELYCDSKGHIIRKEYSESPQEEADPHPTLRLITVRVTVRIRCAQILGTPPPSTCRHLSITHPGPARHSLHQRCRSWVTRPGDKRNFDAASLPELPTERNFANLLHAWCQGTRTITRLRDTNCYEPDRQPRYTRGRFPLFLELPNRGSSYLSAATAVSDGSTIWRSPGIVPDMTSCYALRAE